MTKLLIIVTVAVLCGVDALLKPGTPVSRATNQCEGKAPGRYCSTNDCETLVSCDANGGAREVPCSFLNAANKYCLDGVCQSTMPAGKCLSNFACNAQGYLPEPNNCQLFYYCPEVGTPPIKFDCEIGYSFDISTLSCKTRYNESDCALMVCNPGFNGFIKYGPSPTIYAQCLNGVPSVYKCKDDVYEEFSEVSGRCEVVCKKEGNQENRRNCKTFHYCYIEEETQQMTMHLYHCPPGLGFDTKKNACTVAAGNCQNAIF